jgi:hypothetical protein
MALRDALRKAAGLLVEMPPEEADNDLGAGTAADFMAGLDLETEKGDATVAPTPPPPPPRARTVEEIVRETEGPNLDEIKVAPVAPLPLSGEGDIDTTAIYNSANLPAVPFSAEQMLDMLASLPAELPLETKRQTVKVTLASIGKTVGATPDTIVADASRKIAALTAYVENLNHQTNDLSANVEKEIASLQAQIEEKRKTVQDARFKLTQVTDKCSTEAHRLDDVLEFFSLDVPPSKYSGPAAPAPTPPQ